MIHTERSNLPGDSGVGAVKSMSRAPVRHGLRVFLLHCHTAFIVTGRGRASRMAGVSPPTLRKSGTPEWAPTPPATTEHATPGIKFPTHAESTQPASRCDCRRKGLVALVQHHLAWLPGHPWLNTQGVGGFHHLWDTGVLLSVLHSHLSTGEARGCPTPVDHACSSPQVEITKTHQSY